MGLRAPSPNWAEERLTCRMLLRAALRTNPDWLVYEQDRTDKEPAQSIMESRQPARYNRSLIASDLGRGHGAREAASRAPPEARPFAPALSAQRSGHQSTGTPPARACASEGWTRALLVFGDGSLHHSSLQEAVAALDMKRHSAGPTGCHQSVVSPRRPFQRRRCFPHGPFVGISVVTGFPWEQALLLARRFGFGLALRARQASTRAARGSIRSASQ